MSKGLALSGIGIPVSLSIIAAASGFVGETLEYQDVTDKIQQEIVPRLFEDGVFFDGKGNARTIRIQTDDYGDYIIAPWGDALQLGQVENGGQQWEMTYMIRAGNDSLLYGKGTFIVPSAQAVTTLDDDVATRGLPNAGLDWDVSSCVYTMDTDGTLEEASNNRDYCPGYSL